MSINRVCVTRVTVMGSDMGSWLFRLNPSSVLSLARALATGLTVLVLLITAYAHGYRNASAKGDAKLAAYEARVANAQAEAARLYVEQIQAEVARADAVAVKLLAQQADIARLTKQLQKRVSHVSTVYVDRVGDAPRPLPDRPFTAGWVRDYNAALGLRMPSTLDLAAESARTSLGLCAVGGDPELARSAVTQADVLTVHHANSRICRDAVAQLNAILDLYEEKRP